MLRTFFSDPPDEDAELFVSVLFDDSSDLRDRGVQFQLRQLDVEGRILTMETKRGRITGRQAQIKATAHSAADHIANEMIPIVNSPGLAMDTARAMLPATTLEIVSSEHHHWLESDLQ